MGIVCLVILYCRVKRKLTMVSRTNDLEGRLSTMDAKNKNEQELDEIVTDGVSVPDQTGGGNAVTKGGNDVDVDAEIVYEENGDDARMDDQEEDIVSAIMSN